MTHALHIELAKKYWTNHVHPGDCIVDATCGNGHDTVFLCELLQGMGNLISIDIQEEALQNTAEALQNLSTEIRQTVHLLKQSHAKFPPLPQSPRLIVYNLGYLPGGEKEKTTQKETTLQSLEAAYSLLQPGGAISVMCYPGHPEGALETKEVLTWAKNYPVEIYAYVQTPQRAFQRSLHPEGKAPIFLWISKTERRK